MKARSKASSWSPENVVLDLRCFLFRVIPGSDSVSESSHDDGPIEIKKYFVGARYFVVSNLLKTMIICTFCNYKAIKIING